MPDANKKPAFLPDLPIQLESESHNFLPPLDIQNTSVGNFINLLVKDKYTPKYDTSGLKQAYITKVIKEKSEFEYNPNIEAETYYNNNKDPIRYKVCVRGENGKCDVVPDGWEDTNTIDASSDYYLDPNLDVILNEGDEVYVDTRSKCIKTTPKTTQSTATTTKTNKNSSPPPSAKAAASGPPSVSQNEPTNTNTPENKNINLLTEQQLKKIFPSIQNRDCTLYTKAFNDAFKLYSINTTRRIAAFLGQIGVESGELKYNKELPSKYNKRNVNDVREPVGTLYEGRKSLGNVRPGDGPKFIGRGILQLTGRTNYESYSKKLGIDIVSNPDLASDPLISTKIACQYFKDRGLLQLADNWELEKITEIVNGTAKLHLDARIKYSQRAANILNG